MKRRRSHEAQHHRHRVPSQRHLRRTLHVVLFEDTGPDGSRKVAVLFEEPYHCAVLDVAKLAAGDIAFGSNSFRGDNYEPHLRQALAVHPKTAGTLLSPADKPVIAVVSIRGGLVEEVRTNQPLHVLVEDWDGTEVRPSHDPIIPERMLPGEEAELANFFQPATNQGD